MKNQHLHFNTSIGVQKPENIRNKQQPCPFCDREQLSDIIAENGQMLLLKNKYPVLENAYQTVLIETDQCEAEFSTYEQEHLHRLLQFGINHWLMMEASGEYESVIYFKNHGPLSGGTISHPHMQIIGLQDLNYKEKVNEEVFEGLVIKEQNEVRLTLSTRPRVGFYEFNVRMNDQGYRKEFGQYLQNSVHYILNHFPFKASSYNIFFHHLGGYVYAKMIPRFVTTPLYIGYGLPQVPNNLESMVEEVQKIYFRKP